MVKTRRQTRIAQVAHLESPTNLANLPAEIIHEIARFLDQSHRNEISLSKGESLDVALDLSDSETVISVGEDADSGPVKEPCRLTCCRTGKRGETSTAGHKHDLRTCIRDSSNLSACSRRLREIIFVDGRRRARNIRYCEWWRKETLALPEMVRRQYKKIKVIGNSRHRLPTQEDSQLAGMIRCFPRAEHVDVNWYLTIANTDDKLIPAAKPLVDLARVRWLQLRMNLRHLRDPEDQVPQELGMLFAHLRLPCVVNLEIVLQNMVQDEQMGTYFDRLSESLSSMVFPALRDLYLEFDVPVHGLPVEDVWHKVEQLVDSFSRLAPLTSIHLVPFLIFNDTDEVLDTVFPTPGTLHEAYTPSKARLAEWVSRMTDQRSMLTAFEISIGWDVFGDITCDEAGRDPADDLFTFSYSRYSGYRGVIGAGANAKASTPPTAKAPEDGPFEYTVGTEWIKYVHQVLTTSAAQDSWDDGSDDSSDDSSAGSSDGGSDAGSDGANEAAG